MERKSEERERSGSISSRTSIDSNRSKKSVEKKDKDKKEKKDKKLGMINILILSYNLILPRIFRSAFEICIRDLLTNF